ncbi:MAG: VOC family protein, partial [Bacteroidota bacterium]|nr:VOC family protein [Bacteroidota bacterium]
MKKMSLLVFFFFSALLINAQKPKVVLNHIAVYVTDLSKSTIFYQTIIGLDTIPEPFHDGKHTWFKVAEHSQLHLIQGATGPSPLT